jgi:hypothetical protein
MPCVRQLRDSEAAYVAGIVDGEGTITLTRIHRGENRRPVVSISSTERVLLEYVLLVVGAGRITNKRRSRAHHSASFAYVISSRNALALLSQLVPYLHTYKRDRASLLSSINVIRTQLATVAGAALPYRSGGARTLR